MKNWLCEIKGIGPKTASWIIRNWYEEEMAIIDVHIFRACKIMGIFDDYSSIQGNYNELETRFLKLPKSMKVKSSELDLIIWHQARNYNSLMIKILNKERDKICQDHLAIAAPQ